MTRYPSDNEYRTAIERNQNWNFWVNVLDLTFYNLAMSFIYGATVLSLYASYLTESALLIGLIPALQSVMFLLPQLLLARRIQTLSRMKPMLTRISILERLPYAVVALSIFLWPGAPRTAAYGILLLSMVVATGSGGLGWSEQRAGRAARDWRSSPFSAHSCHVWLSALVWYQFCAVRGVSGSLLHLSFAQS